MKKLYIFLIAFFSIGVFLTVANFLIQMWEIGYTTADDTALSGRFPHELWDDLISNFPLFNYRVNFIPSLFLGIFRQQFPYSHIYFRLFAIVPLIIEIFLFCYMFGLIFKNKILPFIVAVFLFTGFQHAWYHHSLTSYSLNFHLAFSFLLLAYIYFIQFMKNEKPKTIILSGFFCAIAASVYELFFPYLLIFPLLIFFNDKYRKKLTINKACKDFALFMIPLLPIILANAWFYLSKGMFSGYRGNSMVSDFSLLKYLEAIWVFSSSALPGTIFGHYYHEIIKFFGVSGEGFEYNNPFEKMRVVWLVIPFTAVGAIFIFGKKIKEKNYSFLLIGLLFIIGVLFIGLPNLLLCLSKAHQGRALSNTEIMYTGTHFSLYGWVLFLCVSILFLKKVFQKYYLIPLFALSGIVFLSVYKNQISNTFIANVQALNYSNWRLLEEFYDEGMFDKYPADETIYFSERMLGIDHVFWGIFHPHGWTSGVYWYKFSKNAFGKNLSIYPNIVNCELVEFNCKNRKNQYQLKLDIQYLRKTATMKICPMVIGGKPVSNIPEKCQTKEFRTYF